MPERSFDDFTRFDFPAEVRRGERRFDVTHKVYVGGAGPPVILLHELDGFRPPVMRLAERLAFRRGFRVYLPRFFGKPWLPEMAGSAVGFAKVCIRREFYSWATGKASPVADWVRALARHAAKVEHTDRVGVVGMCLTGGIALAAVTEDKVGAAVAAQPSLPFAFGVWPFTTKSRKQDLGLSPAELTAVRGSETPILGLRFCGDKVSPEERLCALAELPGTTTPALRGEGHATLTAMYRKQTRNHLGSDEAISIAADFLHEHLQEAQ